MNPLTRRQMLSSLAGVVGGSLAVPRPALAIPEFDRPGDPTFLLSLAAYSFRDYFATVKGNPQKTPDGREPMTMAGFIDYCAARGLAGAELTGYFFPPEFEAADYRKIRRHAFLRGVAVSGTAIGNDFTLDDKSAHAAQIADAKVWIDRAAAMGAPHIRLFAGSGKGREKDAAMAQCIAALEECSTYAGEHGIFVGLENHGGIVAEADDLLAITGAVDSDWFGISLDTGNFHTANPYGDLARCAPYAVNVQVKARIRPADGKESPADYTKIAQLLRDDKYQGFVVLEYEEETPLERVPSHLKALAKALE
ncbi:sugar phosphate isomerase/epimerase [soil metagenome]